MPSAVHKYCKACKFGRAAEEESANVWINEVGQWIKENTREMGPGRKSDTSRARVLLPTEIRVDEGPRLISVE
jgi:hypothetical protein